MKIYVAGQMDTLYTISYKFQIGLDQLMSVNPHISSAYVVIAGQHVNLPTEPVRSTGYRVVFGPDTPRADALAFWFGPNVISWVADLDGRIAGITDRAESAGLGRTLRTRRSWSIQRSRGRGTAGRWACTASRSATERVSRDAVQLRGEHQQGRGGVVESRALRSSARCRGIQAPRPGIR